MCNYYGYQVSRLQFIRLKQIEKEFGLAAALEVVKSGFSYSNATVLVPTADKIDFTIEQMHWEFIPPWIKNEEELAAARRQGIPWLNARSETVLSSKMFRDAALQRRCLVLATHFFEWRHYKPEGAKKEIAYPYLIELADQDYFYMAGIWQPWTNRDTGEVINTFAIVTTEANELMSVVHNKKKRQPTILTEELAWEWMMGDLKESRIAEIARYQLPSENFSAYTIQKDFRTAEDPLAEFEYEDLPALDIAT